MRALIVEDDKILSGYLAKTLSRQAYATVEETKIAKISSKKQGEFDVALIDLGLPGTDGTEVIKMLRKCHPSRLVIIVLTGRDTSAALEYCLEIGADDFIAKPFNLVELKARLKRSVRAKHPGLVEYGLGLEPRNLLVTSSHKQLKLTRNEFALLRYLLLTPEVRRNRKEIYLHVWGIQKNLSTNRLEVCISRLRAKLDAYFPDFKLDRSSDGYMIRKVQL